MRSPCTHLHIKPYYPEEPRVIRSQIRQTFANEEEPKFQHQDFPQNFVELIKDPAEPMETR